MLVLGGTIDKQTIINLADKSYVDEWLAAKAAYGLDDIFQKTSLIRECGNLIVDNMSRHPSKRQPANLDPPFYIGTHGRVYLSAHDLDSMKSKLQAYKESYYLLTTLEISDDEIVVIMFSVASLNITGEAQTYLRNMFINNFLEEAC